MNVVVEERTREVGIKMALGARAKWILRQFLLETMLITGVGGAIGFAISLAVCAIFPKFGVTEYVGNPDVSFAVAAVTAAILGLTGLVAGYFPAKDASHLDPGRGDEAMTRHDVTLVFQLFFRSARLQKKRATLTIASLAWGTVTILLLLAFGEGLKRQMQSNEQAMGSNLAILWPGETSKPYKGLAEGRSDPPAPRRRRLRARAHARPRRGLGRAHLLAHGARLRPQDGQRARHRDEPELRRPAQALPEARRPLPRPERRSGQAPRRLPRQRARQGALRRGRAGRQDPARQQLAVHGHRRDAAKAPVLDLRRARRAARDHPRDDLQGASSGKTG